MYQWKEYNFKSYTKFIVLRIDAFQTEIMDECNLDPADQTSIDKFLQRYIHNDNYHIVKIEM